VELDPTRPEEVIVGLDDVRILDAHDDGELLTIVFESTLERPTCPTCSGVVHLKDRREVPDSCRVPARDSGGS
jgi:hypothetical protein